MTPQEIAETAADNILINRAAKNMSVHVSRDKVIDFLKEQPGLTNEMLEGAARQQGTDVEGLIENMRQNQEKDRVKAMVGLTAHASLFELWQEYQLAHEKITLQLAAYPTEGFEKQVVVNDQDLEKYLSDNKNAFHVPQQRRYAYVKVSKQDLRDQIKPTDQQLQAYYEQNQAQYLKKASTRTEEIFAPLGQDGASSTSAMLKALDAARPEAAKEANWTSLTQRLNAKNPGLKFMRLETTIDEESSVRSPKYIERMKTLAKDQVSTPVLDTQGVYLFRVLEQKAAGTPPLAEIRSRVENDYRDKVATEELAAKTKQFNEELKKIQADSTTTTSLRSFAQAVKAKDELTTRIKATEFNIPGLGSQNENKDYIAGLQPDQLSEVIVTPEMVAVVEVVEEKGDYDPKLSEVRPDVEKALRKSKAIELARSAAEQSITLLKGGADFNKAVANAPKPPVETGAFTRTEPVQSLGAPLIDFTKQTLKIATGSTGMSPYGNEKEKPQGYAVWKVKSLTEPLQKDFARDRAQFEQDYLQVARETIVREWLADKRRQAQFQEIAEKRDKEDS